MEDTNKILHMMVDAGQIVLENGGETSRVQETARKIGTAFGMAEADSFAMPTGIMASVTDGSGQTVSLIRRITKRSINLEKISRINGLSRHVQNGSLTINETAAELERIVKVRHYPKIIDILFAGIATGACTLLFEGSFMDVPAAFVIGGIIKALSFLMSTVRFNEFFTYILGGALSAILSLLAVRFGLAVHADKVIIGSIMLLVPGIAIVNGIRDTIMGDLVAGISRIVEAFIIAVAIAAGTGMILALWKFV